MTAFKRAVIWAKHSPYFYAFLVLVLAFTLRIWELGKGTLWVDESVEYWVASSNIANLLKNVRIGILDPPLFSFILHFWMTLGQTEAPLRFLSVLFSELSVLGIIVLGWQAGGGWVGVLAGLIMAVFPAEIRYAQEIGQYAIMENFIVWSLVVLQGISRSTGFRRFLLWVVMAWLAVYSYYGAIFTVLVPFGLETLLSIYRKEWQNFKNKILAAGLFSAGVIPLVVFFLPYQFLRGPSSNAFNVQGFLPVNLIVDLFKNTGNVLAFQVTGYPWSEIPPWLPAVLVILLLSLAAVYRRTGQTRRLLFWLLGTWVFYVVASWVVPYPYGFRYSLILSPLLIPLMALGIAILLTRLAWRRLIGVGLMCTLVALALVSLPIQSVRNLVYPGVSWGWPETNFDIHPVIDYWRNHRTPEDITYVYYGAVPIFRYYLRLEGLDNPQTPPLWFIDCWKKSVPSNCNSNGVVYGQSLRNLPPAEELASIQSSLPPNTNKFWMVFISVYSNEREVILEQLKNGYRIDQSLIVPGVYLYHFTQ